MRHSETLTITRAEQEDAPALAGALSRAFQEDPVFRWVVPDGSRRRERLPSVFAAFVDLYLPYQATYLAGDGLGGALWAPAGSELPAEDEIDAFGDRLAASLGGDAERALELGAILEEHHPETPAFHLQFMGVVPGQQGRGIGSRLLATGLEVCDVGGVPAYLEATSPDNRRLYERHDFHTIAQIDLPQGPSLWAMWREPQQVLS